MLAELKNSDLAAPISPFKEIVAYEALWKNAKASYKTLSQMFAQSPGKRPSDFVHEAEIDDFAQSIREIFSQKPYNFRINLLINGTLDYPSKLRQAKEPVEVLYYSGVLDFLYSRSVAIVGTRRPSEDGIKRAEKLTRLLVEDDFTIVSGLAHGIDTVAHKTAMSMNKGRTIAVIGTPLDKVYPKENAVLQYEIAQNHLLISQVPFYRYRQQGAFGNKLFFPERNKTMSAITEATVIIEASDTSGTLIQARAALEQGRKLFILDSCFRNSSITWPAKFEKLGAVRVEKYEDIKNRLSS